jgi:hypothetical protein
MWRDIKLLSQFGLVLLYGCCIFSPYIIRYQLIIPLSLGLVFFITTIRKIVILNEPFLYTVLAFIGISVLYRFVGISSGDFGNYAYRLLWLFSVWMAFYVWKFRSTSERKLLAVVISLEFLANLVYSAYFHYLFPEFNAVYQASDEYLAIYGKVNIGSTTSTMAALFYTLFLLILLRLNNQNFSNFNRRVLWSIECLLIYYIIFEGDSTTTTITLIFSALFILFHKEKNSLLPILICCLFLLLFNVYLSVVVDFCRQYINDRLADRLVAISHMFSQKESYDEENILSRLPMLWFDIKSWFSSPLSIFLGNGYHSVATGELMRDIVVNKAGGHSAIFDSLSRYGLVGLFLMIKLLKNLIIWLFTNIPEKHYAINIFLVIVFSNIFNVTLEPSVLFTIFFFIPFLNYNTINV